MYADWNNQLWSRIETWVLPTPDASTATLSLVKQYLDYDEAVEFYQYAKRNFDWKQRGTRYVEPRLTCAFGKTYAYSNVVWNNSAWDPAVKAIRDRLVGDTKVPFNQCLANAYVNGQQSIGWHADDEASLGNNPIIATLSFGQTREFRVRQGAHGLGRSMMLRNGDLIVMQGTMQRYYQHAILKEDVHGGRVSLTFRVVW